MILGILSDTHGHRKQMHEVADRLVQDFGAEWIYHAGDDYSDAQELDFAGHKVRAVPGLWCPEYNGGRTPKRIMDAVDGITLAMAHAEKDLTAREHGATLIVTGHTHTARIERIGRHIYLNPGHMKGPHDRGEHASFAVVRLEESEVVLAIHELDGRVREIMQVPRDKID